MNQTTRSTLAAVLTTSVIVLSGGLVLADAASDYETIFGAEAKKVAAGGIKSDDAAFAAKLLKSARKMPDSPKLQILLYEKACQFGSSGPARCDTALQAPGLLEKAVPARKAQWRRRKFEIVKLRFDKSYGAARKAAGKPYMEMLESFADAKVMGGDGADATAFCTALSKKTGREGRLPSEAQWEYACRAGTRTPFSFGNEDKDFDAHGWYNGNSGGKTHPTGRKKPNLAGLYDMHGNVWESCRHWYDEKFYAKAKNVDPENTTKARYRILRGGSWFNGSDYCRAAARYGRRPEGRHSYYGFRVVVESASGGK